MVIDAFISVNYHISVYDKVYTIARKDRQVVPGLTATDVKDMADQVRKRITRSF
jgi:hypothetical protein